jgi:hypothetical protein
VFERERERERKVRDTIEKKQPEHFCLFTSTIPEGRKLRKDTEQVSVCVGGRGCVRDRERKKDL